MTALMELSRHDLELELIEDMASFTHDPEGFAYYAYPWGCLLYTSPSPRDRQKSRMPSSA